MNMSDEFARRQRTERLSAFVRVGLREETFSLHYQDIQSLANNAPAAREALLRWGGSHRAIPCTVQELFEVAEATGRIIELGGRILDWACRDAAEWPDRCPVSVNVSPRQLIAGDFAARTFDALSRTGLAAERFNLEITETIMLAATREVIEQLRSLHNAGVTVTLDDFGTGYSSLRSLQQFPFEAIKLDKCFAAHAPYDYKSREIIAAVAALGENLGIRVIAEGIETCEQLDLIRVAGCKRAQGFLFSRPRSQEALLGELMQAPARRKAIGSAEIIAPDAVRQNWRISGEAKVVVGGFRRDAPRTARGAGDKLPGSNAAKRGGDRRPPPPDGSDPSPPAG